MVLLRRLCMLVTAGGGVWLAFRLVDILALQANHGDQFQFTREGEPLLIPIGMLGALIGALFGGLVFPVRR